MRVITASVAMSCTLMSRFNWSQAQGIKSPGLLRTFPFGIVMCFNKLSQTVATVLLIVQSGAMHHLTGTAMV